MSWTLKLHEYSHLSYLLSYVLVFIAGSFLGTFWKRKKEHSYGYLILIIFGLQGFVWKFNFLPIELFLFALLFVLFSTMIPLLKKEREKTKITIFILALPIFLWCIYSWKLPFISKKQSQFIDRVIHSSETDLHQVDVTSWRGNRWYYYNGKVQFSTLDEWMYSEPMIHPLMKLTTNNERVLLIGGENGILLKELLKYKSIQSIDLFALDSKLYDLARKNDLFTRVNESSLNNKKAHLLNGNLKEYLTSLTSQYDVIVVDVPDPINEQWSAYYTKEFYKTCYGALNSKGMMITQAGSPYFATKAFVSIEKTMQTAKFQTLPIHNQVLTLGEWGWVLGAKAMDTQTMELRLLNNDELPIMTKWLNTEAIQMLMSFGKPLITIDSVEVNTTDNPILIEYYKTGNFRFK